MKLMFVTLKPKFSQSSQSHMDLSGTLGVFEMLPSMKAAMG